jgi:hypothetical protein
VTQLRHEKSAFDSRNAAVLIVSFESPAAIRRYAGEPDLPGPVGLGSRASPVRRLRDDARGPARRVGSSDVVGPRALPGVGPPAARERGRRESARRQRAHRSGRRRTPPSRRTRARRSPERRVDGGGDRRARSQVTASLTVCVFAKSPQKSAVKTRLTGAVGTAGARRLARAFLGDTVEALRAMPGVRTVVATTGPLELELPEVEVWDQGAGSLGERLERVLRRALEAGSPVLALGADSPGLPMTLVEAARAALGTHGAAIGPSDDGGFWGARPLRAAARAADGRRVEQRAHLLADAGSARKRRPRAGRAPAVVRRRFAR